MKVTIFLTVFYFCFSALAAVTPELRPEGLYLYAGELLVSKKRSAISISHVNVEGQAKIKNYKRQNFICIRKNQKETICQKNEAVKETPEFAKLAVSNLLAGKTFEFSGTGQVELIHDGADTEWLVTEPVILAGAKIKLFKIIRQNNGIWAMSFPVSEEQGIANMYLYSNTSLGLPLILQRKEAELTVGYFLTANLVQQLFTPSLHDIPKI